MAQDPSKSQWIVDADDNSFQREAVERSREVLVVVDFWATWCQPCRLLSPILEQLVRDYGGKFVLVKADTDKAPHVAGGMGVQSIPAVFAMRNGELLDYFVGLKPEGQIREWLDRLLPSPAEELVAAGKKVAETDAKAAEAKFREAAALDSNLAAARIALAQLLLKQGRKDECQQIVDELEKRGFMEPEAERVKAELHMAQGAAKGGDLEKLRTAAADPKNLAARLDLAKALAAAQKYEEALATALAIVQTGKKVFVEPARVLMVDVFRLLGDDSELVTDYRRRLSTALY